MQLRRLELVGFKTFVDRTELEFHPGITAIVGPNGSGKSNIFDGIRWALGETNARMLRGARMEDVIFSGSASRKPTGMASVALTLDNSAGLLPISFNEVTVGRVVTRGGEGEYAINGVDCRLRDIQMLFLGTGLGGRSYALIGQGEVDAVLRATPVERRHWLEEAAGLARHKRQRTEAERRLDRAQAHLDRLTDLVDELSHQQQTLAAQAEAATQHQAYAAELRDLELALFADEARRLLGAVRRLAAQVTADREQLAAAEARVTEAAADVAMVEAQLASATAAWERGQQSLLEGAETLNVRAADVQALDAQAEGLRGRMTQLNAEIARLSDEHAALSADAATLESDAAAAERRRADALRDLTAAEAALAAAASAAETARRALARGQDEAVAVARTLAQTRSDLAALRARADVIAQSVEATARRVDALGETKTALVRDHQRAQEACDEARRIVGAADDALAAASRALEVLRQEAAAAAEAAHAAELEEHRVTVRLHAIEEAAAQFVGFEESTRDVLMAARADPARFPGLRGAVGDLLRVPEAHRPAIAAALGERLHSVVVDDPAQLDAIVAFVQAEAGRHGTALALNALRDARPSVDPTSFNGDVRARAVEIVEADPPVRAVVSALLGDVILADDLAAAWRIYHAGYTGRIVTRDGTVLSGEGVVTVGGAVQGEAAPLARPQVIEELRAVVAEASARRRETADRRTAVAHDVARAEDALRTAQADRAAAVSMLGERQQQIARLAADVARISEEEIAQTTAARSGTEHLARLHADITRLQGDAESLDAEVRRFDVEIAALREALERREREREVVATDVTTRRLALVQVEGTLEAIRARLADRTAALADIEVRRAEMVAAAGQTSAELASVVVRRDQAQAAYDHLVAAQTGTKVEVERLAADRTRLREELAARQAEHAAAAEAAHAAEVALHRTELRAAQADAELGAAEARLREQYGIPLDDAAARRLEGSRDEAKRRLDELREALRALGPVNLRAIEEHAAVAARLESLQAQTGDIRDAGAALRQAITMINAALRVRFRETFDEVNREFSRLFERLFEGGQGALELVEDELGAEPGLEVIAQLPGKRRRPLVALSGGERSLVAITLIFAMLQVHPSPFCIFDEVEAALDDANTRRFTELLRDLAKKTQVLIITHNKGTMAAADVLYGVTMQEPGLSSIVSVRLVPASPNGDRPTGAARAATNGAEPQPNGEEPHAASAAPHRDGERPGHPLPRRETATLPAE
ncbi:MAG: chromosome segregation protein SMC [Armatimonadota bacterium]|nr:chromosome segregation protein SMC [Armatimonadota bacterium]